MALIDQWPYWPAPAAAIIGPPGSGKSHLGAIFAARTGAVILSPETLTDLPDAPAYVLDALYPDLDEQALFHVWNRCVQAGGSMLLLASQPLDRLQIGLPDLQSRLATAPQILLGPPDDALVMALLIKQFRDRGVTPSKTVLRFLVDRIERDYGHIRSTVAQLDALALEGKSDLSLSLVRAFLTQA